MTVSPLVLAPFASPAQAQAVPPSFADLVDQFSPAVVDITTSSIVAAEAGGGMQVPPGSPFEKFFKDFQGDQPPRQEEMQRSEALGSGYIISADGYVVTNNHVIEGADDIQVETFGGKTFTAKLIGRDPKTDVALLKIDSETPLPFVSFGDSDKMRVGDWVVAMGNPLGQGFSVSAGIVSARGRELNGTYDDFLQTDAAINKGNSGGPLFNVDGEVIGMNTAILSPSGGSIGIGFAMASNVVTKVVDQLKQYGETRRGWLGVRIQDVSEDVADAMGLAEAKGALVTDVPDGPGKDAGILSGDVIVTFNGQEVKDSKELVRRVADAPIGEVVPVLVLRDGKQVTLDVKLGRREEAEGEAQPAADKSTKPAEPQTGEMMGLTLQAITDEMVQDLGLTPGDRGLVVMKVDVASEAYTKGLREGDVIMEAGQQKIASLKDLEARVAEAREGGRKSILLLVRTQGDPRFVALSVE
ncbi:Do family serine endopeptidase [Stagnihabitans tardus]|uniref:Probable periplasmic serine endoprotease DegP-like n=1 Tax=Stagnihabitans tardus TaxID=2699202 RepID=A0AAE4YD43_9RHOB|nr:Do family serine endopeptidase [Stagnihabitans tardus]NBZ89462.1 Do family serine endopeptidase [Stagnihabitans tardus]